MPPPPPHPPPSFNSSSSSNPPYNSLPGGRNPPSSSSNSYRTGSTPQNSPKLTPAHLPQPTTDPRTPLRHAYSGGTPPRPSSSQNSYLQSNPNQSSQRERARTVSNGSTGSQSGASTSSGSVAHPLPSKPGWSSGGYKSAPPSTAPGASPPPPPSETPPRPPPAPLPLALPPPIPPAPVAPVAGSRLPGGSRLPVPVSRLSGPRLLPPPSVTPALPVPAGPVTNDADKMVVDEQPVSHPTTNSSSSSNEAAGTKLMSELTLLFSLFAKRKEANDLSKLKSEVPGRQQKLLVAFNAFMNSIYEHKWTDEELAELISSAAETDEGTSEEKIKILIRSVFQEERRKERQLKELEDAKIKQKEMEEAQLKEVEDAKRQKDMEDLVEETIRKRLLELNAVMESGRSSELKAIEERLRAEFTIAPPFTSDNDHSRTPPLPSQPLPPPLPLHILSSPALSHTGISSTHSSSMSRTKSLPQHNMIPPPPPSRPFDNSQEIPSNYSSGEKKVNEAQGDEFVTWRDFRTRRETMILELEKQRTKELKKFETLLVSKYNLKVAGEDGEIREQSPVVSRKRARDDTIGIVAGLDEAAVESIVREKLRKVEPAPDLEPLKIKIDSLTKRLNTVENSSLPSIRNTMTNVEATVNPLSGIINWTRNTDSVIADLRNEITTLKNDFDTKPPPSEEQEDLDAIAEAERQQTQIAIIIKAVEARFEERISGCEDVWDATVEGEEVHGGKLRTEINKSVGDIVEKILTEKMVERETKMEKILAEVTSKSGEIQGVQRNITSAVTGVASDLGSLKSAYAASEKRIEKLVEDCKKESKAGEEKFQKILEERATKLDAGVRASTASIDAVSSRLDKDLPEFRRGINSSKAQIEKLEKDASNRGISQKEWKQIETVVETQVIAKSNEALSQSAEAFRKATILDADTRSLVNTSVGGVRNITHDLKTRVEKLETSSVEYGKNISTLQAQSSISHKLLATLKSEGDIRSTSNSQLAQTVAVLSTQLNTITTVMDQWQD